MSPDPNSSFSSDEKFVIGLLKVTTMVYLVSIIRVGLTNHQSLPIFLAVASLGMIALSEIFFLAVKQGADNLMRTQIGFSIASWILGAAAGVFLL